MSWLNTPNDKLFINKEFNAVRGIRVLLFLFGFFTQVSVKAWDVDFSRRTRELEAARGPASQSQESLTTNFRVRPVSETLMEKVSTAFESGQDVVLLLTDKGFIPSQINLRKGRSYRVHVVNVNSKEKNVSFVVDSFSESLATYFGEPKSFVIQPKVEGVHSFVSPETAFQGRFVVLEEAGRTASASR
ncbi:MAG: hypothetical protein WCH11_02315 [Bdellovibrio sp.]